MGILTRAFSGSDSTPAQHVGGGFWGGLFGGGSLVNGKSALTLSAFYNGVEILSSDIAMLPKAVFKKDGKNRVEYKEHPANYLISAEPNPGTTAFDFWKNVRVRQILKGNAYVKIVRNERTGVMERLRFLDNVTVTEKDDALYYTHKGTTYSGDEILHFKGFSLDGKIGVGIITFAAHQLGVTLEAQKYAGEVYENKGMTTGIVTAKSAYTNPVARKAVMDGVRSAFGKAGMHKVGFLDDDMGYTPISVTPAEAQFLETNKNGVIEVCRWLNIAPHKLKNLDNANFSNIYQQSTEHVQYTLMRWVIADEQECNRKLFTAAERDEVYVKWNINFLLKGDLDMKQRYYTAMVYAGIYNRNEIRSFEDMNPADGLDDYLQPVNMQTLEAMMQNLKNLQAEMPKSE